MFHKIPGLGAWIRDYQLGMMELGDGPNPEVPPTPTPTAQGQVESHSKEELDPRSGSEKEP